jgi:hypothetical protein
VANLALTVLRRLCGDRFLTSRAVGPGVRPDAAQPSRLIVDLSEVPQIKQLDSISVWNRGLLDFVRVTGCVHAEGGLFLQGQVGAPGSK